MSKASNKQEVATVEAGALPAYLREYEGALGTENIAADDVTIPRIKLAQSMSPEVKEGRVAEGALFLNVDGRVLAEPGATLNFIPVAFGTEYILWRDQNDGGGIFARARRVGNQGKHFWDKPGETFEHKLRGVMKVKWTTGETVEDDGLGEWGSENPADPDSKIAATKHYNYIVYLPDFDMVAALSLSRSAAKRAKDLNAMLRMGKAPIFARQMTVKSADDVGGDYQFKNYSFNNNGFVDEETFARTREMFEEFGKIGFTVDQSDEDAPSSSAPQEGGSDAF